MVTTISVHPEGPRYVHSLLFVAGLWTPAAAARPLASFLAHRGWAGTIVASDTAGGVDVRADEIAAIASRLPAPPVLVGHDAGGVVALAVARRVAVGAVVWLAPIVPGTRRLTRLVGPWRLAASLLRRRDVPRPTGAAASVLFGSSPPADLCAVERLALVRDVVRGRVADLGRAPCPFAVVTGADDPLGRDGAPSLPGAEHLVVREAGRWLLGGPAWQRGAGVVHRWLVQRLGAENLELYEEAMAERDASDETE